MITDSRDVKTQVLLYFGASVRLALLIADAVQRSAFIAFAILVSGFFIVFSFPLIVPFCPCEDIVHLPR